MNNEFKFTNENCNPFEYDFVTRDSILMANSARNKFPLGSITTIPNRFGLIPKIVGIVRVARRYRPQASLWRCGDAIAPFASIRYTQ